MNNDSGRHCYQQLAMARAATRTRGVYLDSSVKAETTSCFISPL
jgi:hypothetical protein